MNETPCRWGILGTANIARKNWKAIRNAGNATLVSVASRRLDRAAEFVAECQAHTPFPEKPTAIGGYDELIESSAVDAVYLPLPTGLRKKWVMAAIRAGKHVLVEKPCGMNAAEVREMIDAASENHVQFMDGVMFMHSARMEAIRDVLAGGEHVGKIRRIATQFSFMAEQDFLQTNIRGNSQLEPLGCLGDLGWYTIRIILLALGGQLPTCVSGRLLQQAAGNSSQQPVPIEFSAELFYPDNVSASFYCSFVNHDQQWVHISGTNGNLHLSDFVLPFYGDELSFETFNSDFVVTHCDFHMEPHRREQRIVEYSNSHPNAQETKMVRTFSDNVLKGIVDPSWGQWAWKTQRVLDACLESALGTSDVVIDRG